MQRHELEHLIRAASAITNDDEVVVVGCQSILGAVPNPPDSLTVSMEADIYPANMPVLADLIDGAIGEGSPFHERFGYCAQGVGPETAVLPEGWQGRLVRLQNQNTDLRVGLCLDPSDLCAAKLAAGRDKDWVFVREALKLGIVSAETLATRVRTLPVVSDQQARLLAWVSAQG